MRGCEDEPTSCVVFPINSDGDNNDGSDDNDEVIKDGGGHNDNDDVDELPVYSHQSYSHQVGI